jgi:hypothetical protein
MHSLPKGVSAAAPVVGPVLNSGSGVRLAADRGVTCRGAAVDFARRGFVMGMRASYRNLGTMWCRPFAARLYTDGRALILR